MVRKKSRIVTRADLSARYPESTLQYHLWETSEEDPDVGWPVKTEFKPTHEVHFHAYGSGKVPTCIDFVYLMPGLTYDRYQEAFTPTDFDAGIARGPGKYVYRPSYYKDPKTGLWWHATNLHPSWVRGRVRSVQPVTYMRELPSELVDPEEQWGFVYFVSAGVGGPIKIGWSQDVGRRIHELQTANAHKLVLLATLKGTLADEARVHSVFRHLRMEAEWFENTPEILQFIREYAGGL